jgi:hypothetical protein
MSNETEVDETQEAAELEQMKQLLAQEAEAKEAKAAPVEPAPSPEPTPSPAPEAAQPDPTPVTPTPSEDQKPKDDPLKWAEKKGFKTPEDMARALLQKEQEFHQSRQQKEREALPPPPPAWQPRPDMGGFQQPAYDYPPPPPPRGDTFRQVAAMYPQLAPEDVERILPLVVDAAKSVMSRERAALEQRFGHIERTAQRNNELMTLMQDPAFRDERVQKEVHAILDSDPSIFQRERAPLVYAFKEAVFNMGRKQLQQGVVPDTHTPSNKPPVTAGGGNGSAFTAPVTITPEVFEKWSFEDQEAYIKSNGRKLPKR